MTDTPGTLEERMKSRIADWDHEDYREDWPSYQREFAEAADEISSLRARVEAAYAANGDLRDALSRATETMAAQRAKLEELLPTLKDAPDA